MITKAKRNPRMNMNRTIKIMKVEHSGSDLRVRLKHL